MAANEPIPIEQGWQRRLQAAYALLDANLTCAEVGFHQLLVQLEHANGTRRAPVVRLPLAPEIIARTTAIARQVRQDVSR